MKYTDKQLLEKAKSLPSFTSVPKDYWILGLRSNADQFNTMDDKFYIFKGEQFIQVMTGTTNPGGPSLLKPMDSRGSAVIKSNNWYYNVWTRGLHKGKMDALVQTGKFLVIRDNDRDRKAGNSGTESWETGRGLNFHTNSYNKFNNLVSWITGDWSHGCQVANEVKKYHSFLETSKPQKLFTYCLLQEF